ncbi:hypothetical protein Tco_0392739 [Tanacetum coccineum]
MGRSVNWLPLVDRFQKRLSNWKSNSLSIGGRLTLIKAVIGSLGVYFFSTFKAPKFIINKLEGIRRKFLWGGSSDSKKIAWVSWSKVIAPLNQGGLNIGSLSISNQGLLAKWWWRFAIENTSLWCNIIRSIHGPQCGLHDAHSIRSKSGPWYQIAKLNVDLGVHGIDLHSLLKIKVGNGESTRGALENDSAPHLTARQEQTVKLLEIHKAPFPRYPECFLCLVGLSSYYPFDKNSYPAFEHRDGSGGCYFPLVVVQAVEVQKGDDQVKLLESTRHCFISLVIPTAGSSSSAAVAEVSALTEEGQKDVASEDAYLELADPNEGTIAMRQSEDEVVTQQPKKVKKKILLKQSDVLPAKKLRIDHPTLIFDTSGKTLAGLEQIRLVGFLDSSTQTNLRIRTTVESFSILGIPVDTTAAAITSTKAAVTTKFATDVNLDLVGPSQPEESERSDDFFYEPPTLDPSEAKRWYVLRWNITNDSLLDDGAVRQVCLGAEVRSRAEHELELKEKLRAKYTARGRLLEEKDLEILKLKFQLAEKEVEVAEVIRLRDQVSSLFEEKSALIVEVSVLKVTVTQKDHDISLLNSRATCLASTLDDAKVACVEAGNKITSLASDQDRLASKVSFLRAGF